MLVKPILSYKNADLRYIKMKNILIILILFISTLVNAQALVKGVVSSRNEALEPAVKAVNDRVKYNEIGINITHTEFIDASSRRVFYSGNRVTSKTSNSYPNAWVYFAETWDDISYTYTAGGYFSVGQIDKENKRVQVRGWTSPGSTNQWHIDFKAIKLELKVIPEPKVVEPIPEPEPTYNYPIEATVGVIPTEGTFETFETPMQAVIAASRTANEAAQFQEQFLDYQVIENQNPGHWAGNVAMNQTFLQTYAPSGTMSAAAFESWEAYNNWVLGVQDIRSSWELKGETIHKVWDGNWLNYRGYNGWYIHEKSSDFNAVIYP